MGSSDDKSAEVFLPVLLFLLSLLRVERNALNSENHPSSSQLIQRDNVASENCTSSSSHFLTLVLVVVKVTKKAGHLKQFDKETDSVSSCPKLDKLPFPPSLPYLQAVVVFCRSSTPTTATTPTKNIPSISTDGGERGRRTFIVVAQSDKETQQRKKSIERGTSLLQVHLDQQQLSLSVNDDYAGISGQCTDTDTNTAPFYWLPEVNFETPPFVLVYPVFTLNIQSSQDTKAAKLLCIVDRVL